MPILINATLLLFRRSGSSSGPTISTTITLLSSQYLWGGSSFIVLNYVLVTRLNVKLGGINSVPARDSSMMRVLAKEPTMIIGVFASNFLFTISIGYSRC